MAKAIANLTCIYDGTDFKRNYALELADSVAVAKTNKHESFIHFRFTAERTDNSWVGGNAFFARASSAVRK